MKKLTKSNNRKICGVCGGIADFFGIDATIIRLAAVILIFFGIGAGIIIYFVAALILPEPEMSDESIDNLKSANISEEEHSTKTSGSSSSQGHSDEAFNSYFEDEKK